MTERPNPCRAFVLVVEDEVLIRLVAIEALIDAGFEVLEAEHGDAAVEVLNDRADQVVALFTDVQMPGSIDGGELVRWASDRWPWIRCLLTSGNAAPEEAASLPDGCRFLRKPYEIEQMIWHIRELLRFD
jgi:CheY-like chemotaxis protein